MTQSWQFAIAPAVQALPALRGEWQALLQDLPSALPFQTPAWVDAYARHWGEAPGTVMLLSARQQGRLVAVLPLTLGQWRLGPLKLGTVSLVFNPHMPLADITAQPADASLWPALLDWLQRRSGVPCVRLELPGVVRDGTLGQWLAAAPPSNTLSLQTGEAARIDTRGDFDSLLKGVSSKHRSNLLRSTKRAEALGPLRYEEFEGTTLLTQGLPLLLEIEASGWKGRAGTAIDSDTHLATFYRAAIEGLGQTGQCRIGVLWFGDRPAAATLQLLSGRSVCLHKLGYREEWSAMGPGHLCVRELVQRACANPTLDSVGLVLRPPWSDVWRPSASPVDHHSIFAPSLLGRLTFRLADYRRKRAAAQPADPTPEVSAPVPATPSEA
jgi:CelD/BcsL family acetyltransferase involved in cellulose biosynthesis